MRDFTQGSILRHLISFSLPIILADMLHSLYIVIDALWVGRLLGVQALAAVSTTFPVTFFMFSLIIGLSVATNTLVGQAFGAGNQNLLSKVIVNSFVVTCTVCGCFLCWA